MISRSSLAKRVLQVVAAFAIAIPLAVAGAPEEAQASPLCDVWALADLYDHEPKAYGAGGVNSCQSGIWVSSVDVNLYRDGLPVASNSGNDCREHLQPCAFSTGAVSAPTGHSWCAKTVVNIVPLEETIIHQGNCVVS